MGHNVWCYLFEMFHLLMFLPLDYVQPLQLFLIFQKLHNFLPVTNQPLFQGLIKGKSRDIQKLLKNFNGTRIFVSNPFSLSLFSSQLILPHPKKTYLLLPCCYLSCNYRYYFHLRHHSLHLWNNSTNLSMLYNNFYYIPID